MLLISVLFIFFIICIAEPFFWLYIVLSFLSSRGDSCFEKTYRMKSAIIFTDPIHCFSLWYCLILLFSCPLFSADKFLCCSILSLSLLNSTGDFRRYQFRGVDRCIGDTLASAMHSSNRRTIVVRGPFPAILYEDS